MVAIAPRALLDTIETSHGNAFNRMQMHYGIIKYDCPNQRAPSFRAHARAGHFVGAHFPTHGMMRMSKTREKYQKSTKKVPKVLTKIPLYAILKVRRISIKRGIPYVLL